VPFQVSTNGAVINSPPPVPWFNWPTETQEVGEVQETAARRLFVPGPTGLGVGSILNSVPLDTSANVDGPPISETPPTAVQVPDAGQDTPETYAGAVPAGETGLKTVCDVHPTPFQSSATLPSWKLPRAVQASGELHETPESCSSNGTDPVGSVGHTGLVTIQLVPFQLSANGPLSTCCNCCVPTARQAVGELHDTAAKVPKVEAGVD
jgi:hypothetical protein